MRNARFCGTPSRQSPIAAERRCAARRTRSRPFARRRPAAPPAQILAHLGDLFDWALSISQGSERWNNSGPLVWDREVARFFDTLQRLDAHLSSDAALAAPAERIFQGAIADALTHIGQLMLLRRIAGAPVRGENYYRADIVAGRVGPEQTPPHREFS